jgi:hypothetical protein
MVDALRRAHRAVKHGGQIVDLHPTAARARVEVGARCIGHVDAADAPLRHAAAGVALAVAVNEGRFTVDRTLDFTFYTCGDTIDELREYVAANWRSSRIDDDTVDRARGALREMSGAKPRLLEMVTVTALRARAR